MYILVLVSAAAGYVQCCPLWSDRGLDLRWDPIFDCLFDLPDQTLDKASPLLLDIPNLFN